MEEPFPWDAVYLAELEGVLLSVPTETRLAAHYLDPRLLGLELERRDFPRSLPARWDGRSAPTAPGSGLLRRLHAREIRLENKPHGSNAGRVGAPGSVRFADTLVDRLCIFACRSMAASETGIQGGAEGSERVIGKDLDSTPYQSLGLQAQDEVTASGFQGERR